MMVLNIFSKHLCLSCMVSAICKYSRVFFFFLFTFFSAAAGAASFVLCIFSPIHICLYLIVHHNNALLFLKPSRKWKAITKQKRFFHYSASNPFKGVYPLGVLSPCYRGAQLEERVVVGIIKSLERRECKCIYCNSLWSIPIAAPPTRQMVSAFISIHSRLQKSKQSICFPEQRECFYCFL